MRSRPVAARAWRAAQIVASVPRETYRTIKRGRLRPRIMLLSDRDKRLRDSFRVVDLMDAAADGTRLDIRRPVTAAEFDIDLTGLYL